MLINKILIEIKDVAPYLVGHSYIGMEEYSKIRNMGLIDTLVYFGAHNSINLDIDKNANNAPPGIPVKGVYCRLTVDDRAAPSKEYKSIW